MGVKNISLKKLLTEYDEIIIPDIQRDYAMGSGGEKFTALLDAMVACEDDFATSQKPFEFSCLIGYPDGKKLNIYDGQQRLTTLICFMLLNDETSILAKKLKFIGRDTANEWIQEPSKIDTNNAVDFTTYSMAELKKVFNSNTNYKSKLTNDFLLNRINFNMVEIKEVSDAEQFFLDINDGLHLKPYEIYKAKLYNKAKDLPNFKDFALNVENVGIEIFNKTSEPEKYFMYFLKYCLRMMWIEEGKVSSKYDEDEIDWIEKRHLDKLISIINKVNKVMSEVNPDTVKISGVLNSSIKLGGEDSTFPQSKGNILLSHKNLIIKKFQNPRGEHWSLTNTDYDAMLYIFLETISNINDKNEEDEEDLVNQNNNSEEYLINQINNDVLIWVYISKENVDNNYLRFVKKLLNNNRSENKEGWLGVAPQIFYARYYVYGIPTYYIKTEVEEGLNLSNENNGYYLTVICNYHNYDKEIVIAITSRYEKEQINNYNYMENVLIASHNNFDIDKIQNQKLITVLKNEKIKDEFKKEQGESEKLTRLENTPYINGLVDNLFNYETKQIIKGVRWDDGTDYSNIHFHDVYNFMILLGINHKTRLLDGVTINWDWFGQGTVSTEGESLLPHTYCDLITAPNNAAGESFFIDSSKEYKKMPEEQKIEGFKIEEYDFSCFYIDGWIDGDIIYRPCYDSGYFNSKSSLNPYNNNYHPIKIFDIFKGEFQLIKGENDIIK